MKTILFSRTPFTAIVLKLIVCGLWLLVSCRSGEKADNRTAPADTRIEFSQLTFDFGKMTAGETVMHTFRFKNTGRENLLIRNIETGCGCTTADYTREPVAPGKEGKIEIAFNSSGRFGKQYKEIRIFANIPEKTVTLKFTADIQP